MTARAVMVKRARQRRRARQHLTRKLLAQQNQCAVLLTMYGEAWNADRRAVGSQWSSSTVRDVRMRDAFQAWLCADYVTAGKARAAIR